MVCAVFYRRIFCVYRFWDADNHEPAVAYDILMDYNDQPDHGGYSWDEYQEAIQVIIYTVSLIPYR